MAHHPVGPFRKMLAFAPAVTAGLSLAVAVELVAGTAWKGARLAPPPATTPLPEPGRRAAPLSPGILAPVSVYDWTRGQSI